MNTKTIFVLLSTILATSASAQVSILPGGRGNLYIGNPTTLPGPAANIVISPRINLPAPLLTPSVVMSLSPVLTAAAIPAMPAALPVMPAAAIPSARIIAERENVAIPYPALRAQFAAPSKEVNPAKDAVANREKLENLFDGRRRPVRNAEDELGPVRSDRHHSLPENDLEREIGAY